MDRLSWVDKVRGVAIVLMVIFHFCYDLRYFGWVDWNVPNGSGWWQFRYVILTLFIFTVGLSFSLAHSKKIRWEKFLTRLVQLLISAAAITLMSLFMFPNTWIYFGILHFIAFASLVCLVFVRMPLLSLGIGLVMLLAYGSNAVTGAWPFMYADFLPRHTEDYVPFFPWLGVALLGLAFGGLVKLYKFDPLFAFLPKQLGWLGRHGLIVYLLHQPLMMAVLYPLSLLVD